MQTLDKIDVFPTLELKTYDLKDFLHTTNIINSIILLREKFLQFDWLRAVVFQLNLKYFHMKITNLLRVVVFTNNHMICTRYLA